VIVLFIFILQLLATFISFLLQYHTSPLSNYTFTSQSEVLAYLFSGMDERILKSKECAAEMTFQVHLTTIKFIFIIYSFYHIIDLLFSGTYN
jgi:hypothetical protein